ncbi:MAG: mechanosensitive ion channel domain-containing protein [Pseudomonadota bacterium]
MKTSRILAGLLIVVAFAGLAWLVDLVINRIIVKLVKKTSFQTDDAIVYAVHKPIWITVFIFGCIVSIRWIAPPPTFTTISIAILKSLVAVIWMIALNRIIVSVTDDWIKQWQINERTGSEIIGLGGNITRMLVFISTVFIFLVIWNINITPLLASAGIAGVAVALAAKETLSNFFGGVTIMLDRPYKISDYIVLDSGERGEVIHIGLRSTRILTRDDVLISIPNSIITNTKVINESAPEPRYRIRIKVGVAYGSDVDKVEEIMLSLAIENPMVVQGPKPKVRFRNFGDSSLDFELLCWVHRPHDKGKVIHMLNRSIYKTFAEKGIIIPFPQRDVHFNASDMQNILSKDSNE